MTPAAGGGTDWCVCLAWHGAGSGHPDKPAFHLQCLGLDGMDDREGRACAEQQAISIFLYLKAPITSSPPSRQNKLGSLSFCPMPGL